MKRSLGFIVMLFMFVYPSVCHAVPDISGGGSTDSGADNTNCYTQGCIRNYNDVGLRVTIYSESGRRVSDSVDIVVNETYNRMKSKGYEALTTISNKIIGKVDYIKNGHQVGSWNAIKLADVLIPVLNVSGEPVETQIETVPINLLKKLVTYYSEDPRNNLPSDVVSALNLCSSKYSCTSSDRYFVVYEPTMYVWGNGHAIYGTSYELANVLMKTNCSASTSWETCWEPYTKWIDPQMREQLPFRLTIGGESENLTFYKNIGVTEYCPNPNNGCFFNNVKRLGRSDILNKGVAMAVYDITDKMPTLSEDISCSATVNINECGESTINETNSQSCVSDNKVYSYLDICNLYCSDIITADFSGIYNTFVGNNKLNAIKSGKYQSIKGNPKITITKTCYQSKTANECPNVTESFKTKLNQDYKTNNIILNVDGNSYTLTGSPVINNNGYSSATITYEYKLNDIVNKYISIETMKGEDLTEENKNKVIINGTPMIITSKESYGVYKYNLDVSATVLNKYISSGSVLRNFKNTINGKYNIQNKLTINYKDESGNIKTSYTNDDLNYSCSYTKYDALGQCCICAEDTVCDPITCEPVTSSPCVCDGEYGCYDTIDCVPIPECHPPSNDGTDIIYRPISLTNPFPGIDGTNRDPGRNWLGLARDKDGNLIYYKGSTTSLSDYYIRYNRGYDDYELYREAEPLYVINLDANKIKAIREYNDYKDHDYNDFELECDNGENCISKFLRGRANNFNINLIDSGTCKNINSSTFDTCIKRKGA